MASRTRATEPAAEASTGLKKYVVLVDAVNLVTGKKPNGSPAVTRLYRGNVINAPAGHPALTELLSMNGIAEEEHLAETVKAIAKHGNAKRPTAQNKDEAGLYRVTAAGVAVSMGAEDDPALNPSEDILPVDASAPDTTPIATV